MNQQIDTTLGELINAIEESVAEESGFSEEGSAQITKLVLERLMARYEIRGDGVRC